MIAQIDTSSLDAYLLLPVGPGEALNEQLQACVETEQAAHGCVTLTDDFSHEPADLTPVMRAWYSAEVAPRRLQALAELRARFGDDRFGAGAVRGHLFESELDQLEHDRRASQRTVHDRFHRENTSLVKARDIARSEYEHERALAGSRDPILPRPTLYFAVLLVFVVGEFLLNIESIRQVPIITSWALATGATAFCALALGWAGHIHGQMLKQWSFWFGPQDTGRTFEGARYLGIGKVLLFMALGFIAYARSSFIFPKIQQAAILGVRPPSLLGSILAMLLTNVIVYAASAAWSFLRHDANPEYVNKAIKYEKLRQTLQSRIGGLNTELARLDQKHLQNVGRIQSFDREQQSAAAYTLNRAAFARFQAKDEAVKGAMDRYRTALVRRLRREKIDPVFVKARLDKEDAAKTERLSAEDWLATSLGIKLISAS